METNNTNTKEAKISKYINEISDLSNNEGEQITETEKIDYSIGEIKKEEETQTQTIFKEPSAELKKETRGRKKKDTNLFNNKSNDYSDYSQKKLFSDIKTQSTVLPNGTDANALPNVPPIDVSKFITGALMLIVMDAVIPTALIFLVGMFDKKYKGVSKKKLKLDSDEKKALEPLADEIVKYIFTNVNPITAFFLCTTVIYGSKLMTLDDTDFIQTKKPIQKNEAIKKSLATK